jgi:hypothetical protein
VPALGEADPDLLKDQLLLGFGGFTGEVQDEQPGLVGFDRIQVEINPYLWDKTSRPPPLKRSTGPVEAKDMLPPPIQQIEAMRLFDQRASAMPTPSSASAITHELSPSDRPKSSVNHRYFEWWAGDRDPSS